MAIALLVAGLAAAADWVSAPAGGDGGKEVVCGSSQNSPRCVKAYDLRTVVRDKESIAPKCSTPSCQMTLCRREVICPVGQQADAEQHASSQAAVPPLEPATISSRPAELARLPAVAVGVYVK